MGEPPPSDTNAPESARPPARSTQASSIVLVTGLSGAGRTTALHVLEDLGYYCLDNLPTPLLAQAVTLCADQGGHPRVAVGVDVRLRAFLDACDDEIDRLKHRGEPVTVIFLDAEDPVLVRRYSESRRPHPLSAEQPGADLQALITLERERLTDLRVRADRVLDTSRLNAHEFRRLLLEVFSNTDSTRMTTRFVSFGFKHGVPLDADLMFDVRHLPNPHFVPALKPRSGLDPEVASYVLERPETRELLGDLEKLLQPLLPRYAREGKVVLTVAIGCTGGRHRSVAVAETLGARLREHSAPGSVVIAHRDIDRGG